MEKIKLKCKVTIIGPLSFHKNIVIDYAKKFEYDELPLWTFFFDTDEVYRELLINLQNFQNKGFVCEITENG